MFFKGKKKREREEAEEAAEAEAVATEASLAGDTVEGSMPDLAEAELGGAGGRDLTASLSPTVPATPDADAVRLFPGFEHEEFEVGFRTGAPGAALVMRWKEGGEWFRVPPLFNRAVLAAMDERDTAGDLTRLMRSFGYDVEPGV